MTKYFNKKEKNASCYKQISWHVLYILDAQLAGAEEYTDCNSAEG